MPIVKVVLAEDKAGYQSLYIEGKLKARGDDVISVDEILDVLEIAGVINYVSVQRNQFYFDEGCSEVFELAPDDFVSRGEVQ